MKNIPIWDIFKSLFLIFIAIMLWVKADAWIASFSSANSGPQITEATITMIASNLVQLQNVANKAEFEKLKSEILNRETRYITDTDEKIRSALSEAIEYAKRTDSKITTIGETVAKLNSSFKESEASEVYVDAEVASRTYEDYDLVRTMNDGSELPEGWVKYHPYWKGDDKLVQFHYPLKYHTVIVRSEHENGTFAYHTEAWIENDYVKSSKGIKYPIEFESVRFEENPISDKKFRFNPRVGLGGSFTNTAFFPSLDCSLFSYGRTIVDMDWRFVDMGIGGAGLNDKEQDFTLIGSFSPVQYNIGKLLPIVENIFLGPTMSVDTNSDVGYGASLSVPF